MDGDSRQASLYIYCSEIPKTDQESYKERVQILTKMVNVNQIWVKTQKTKTGINKT